MGERERIFIVEDDSDFIDTLSERFTDVSNAGHKIIGIAQSRHEVEDALPSLGKLNVSVVLTDGNLTEGDISGSDKDLLI